MLMPAYSVEVELQQALRSWLNRVPWVLGSAPNDRFVIGHSGYVSVDDNTYVSIIHSTKSVCLSTSTSAI